MTDQVMSFFRPHRVNLETLQESMTGYTSLNTGRTHWLAVCAAVGCGIAVAINVGKVPMSLDLLRQEFGLSLVSAGWVASMLSTLAVFCALFIGVLCDRIGHLRITGIGLAISIAATLAGLFVHDSGGLLFSRFGEGVGFLAVVIGALVARSGAWQDAFGSPAVRLSLV